MFVTFNGARFKSERERQNISQRSLADKAETSERYVRDLEKGIKTNPSAEKLYRFSDALSISMDDLMIAKKGEN